MADVRPETLPFDEAIRYFRDKLDLPTATWTDLWEGQHAKAFTVAGALRDELLADFRSAVDQAIALGTGYDEFRRDFERIVQQHGWSYNGGAGWRSRVIYHTNMQTAYQAGRYAQMDALRRQRPYWRYRHSPLVREPRPEHESWDGLVLRHDDPWWETHYPPNGWGCRCSVQTLSERGLKRLGKDAPDHSPDIEWEEKVVGVRGPNPRSVRVPKGIDPGWAYNPGQAAFGQERSAEIMEEWAATRNDWINLTPAGWAEAGRPERVPLAKPPVSLGRRLTEQAAVTVALERILGGAEKLYKPGGLPVRVNARTLGEHIDPNRSEYLPLLDDLLNDPYEIWIAFEQHRKSKQVRLRARIIKGYDLGNGKILLMVLNARGGFLEGWTFIPSSKLSQMNKRRVGRLIYGSD